MKRYSLADYRLSIDSADPTIKSMFGTISIGGEGSYLGNVSVSQNSNLWNTKGFATGAWAHDKNLDRTGHCNLQLHQLSNDVVKLIRLCNIFYSGNYGSLTLIVSDNLGNKVATCTDSFIEKIPDQSFSESSENQTWSFTCGKVVFG